MPARRSAMQAHSMRTRCLPLPMQTIIVLVLCVLCRECQAIRVPVVWDDEKTNSDVKQAETFTPVTLQQSIPLEYFEYKAHKPQFAVDVAAFHGVKDPENHYKAYPIRPYTSKEKPVLGKHHMLDESKEIYQPYQQYVNEEWQSHITPTASGYDVFHPYKAEEPALQELYKDPVLEKIRNDLKNSKNNLQKYENDAGAADIEEGEYLESPEETDRKKKPHKNVPATFEIHRPHRRPVYYRPPPKTFTHEQKLNHKLRHPWNQNFVKVRPLHYRPLKSHLHNLRQHHSLKYDDEYNEYPQVPPPKNFAEPPDGYDIYLKGQAKYNQLRNNLDESINKAVLKNQPAEYEKLELQNQDTNEESNQNEFIPIKNYAQVRKTETTKHLPKSAALADADSYDDIINAHRLREAIKSTKAQTVYSEEGYEDAAYDHAGEQKHAADHEGHGGFLIEKEISGGKFKTPSFSGKYEDATGSVYKDKKHHGKKWKNDDKDHEEQNDSEDYSEDDQDYSEEEDAYGNVPDEDVRHKREHDIEDVSDTDIEKENLPQDERQNNTNGNENKEEPMHDIKKNTETSLETVSNFSNLTNSSDHDLNKREANFEVPEIDFGSTFLGEKELNKIAKLKTPKAKKSNLQDKYPYYFKKLKSVHRDSPLRYAENLKLIPKKSQGGTEFYDSRSNIQCSEVNDDVDPVPEKVKNNETQISDDDDKHTEETESEKQKFDSSKNKQRLKGLGDKIDCFKAKYFGKNPLDSPFFKEHLIANPSPIKIPKLKTYKLNNLQTISSEIFKGDNLRDLTDLLTSRDVLNNETFLLQDNIVKSTKEPFVKDNIKTTVNNIANINNNSKVGAQTASVVRRKRATPFIYEPYKIIREGQAQESKKTTTTGNISPLIRQLQSSKVVEKVLHFNHDKEQPVKRNVKPRIYKDISRKDRDKNAKITESSFVDLNIDQRRGEPRYELKPANHKALYTPVEHKSAMTLDDYETHTNTKIIQSRYNKAIKPKPEKSRAHILESAASKTVRRVVSTTLPPKRNNLRTENFQQPTEINKSEDYYDNYDDAEEDEVVTTTTTLKPSFRRRSRPTTTTIKPHDEYKHAEEETTEVPKLQLVTRFNKPQQASDKLIVKKEPIKNVPPETPEDIDINKPKYREKKKKSRKSTLVTDTKRYGDDDDEDMRKEEVDALIGVKQNMEDYMPHYEKETDAVMDIIDKQGPESSEEEDTEEEISNEDDDDVEEEDEDDDDDAENEDDIDDEEEENDDETGTENKPEQIVLTTPEPTKRSLVRTTEAPPSTTEAQSAKLEIKPVVHRKKVEIHKELPVNMSAPHVTQFKQDIKEIEITKEMPSKRRKPQKNLEALDLFKDEKLAEEINKLKEVEVFRENLNLKQGPKHGGNYRSAEIIAAPIKSFKYKPVANRGHAKLAATAKLHTKTLNADEEVEMISNRGGHLKFQNNLRPRDNEASNAKHIELSDDEQPHALHGGNLKSLQDKLKSRGNANNEKLIELDDEYENIDESRDMHGGNFKSYENSKPRSGFHGGNYRSAKLDQDEPLHDESQAKDTKILQARSKNVKGGRINAAVILDGFAKAIPILTTTPNYILDPSKRMYYYVDA